MFGPHPDKEKVLKIATAILIRQEVKDAHEAVRQAETLLELVNKRFPEPREIS